MISFSKNNKGSILIMAIVFTAVFVITAGGLVGLALSQNKLGLKKIAWQRSLEIAEAGINYYRWHLAHDPTDYQDGTESPGPYVHDYNDPYGSKIGEFSLTITPPGNCTTAVEIKSTGYTVDEPNTRRTVRAQYALPSLAEFAFLTNSNVWFGEDEELHGPVHSNGGIRQDGENDGIMTSAKETYVCGIEHGCNNETKPGIWGDGELQVLWDYPVPLIDFNSITSDLVQLKSEAQSSGIYFGPSGLGYHLVLKSDGSIDAYRVDQLMPNVSAYDGDGWITESLDIQTETFLGNYVLPSDCATVFVEDDVWVEGVVNDDAVSIVSAVFPDVPSTNSSIIINGNLTYQNKNDQTSLALIAQKDVLIPLYAAPDDLQVDSVLLAQKGRTIRHYFSSAYSPYNIRNDIELYGSIITNESWTWTWVDGNGTVVSGYRNTETIYDPSLKYNPPPGFPTESEFDFIKWEEVTNN